MLFQKLNPQQAQAVRHTEGPLMVVAGAGSGKTRVITCRIAYLIQEKKVSPENILAITFTNKAANEMRERVLRMLNHPESSPWISTFHSFCLRILRKHVNLLGYSNDFVVFDAQDQLTLISRCIKSAGINEEAFPPKSILNHISGFKNDLLLPKDVNPDLLPYGHKLKAAQVYPSYQEELKKNNALDFDDLLVMTVRLFREAEPVRERYSDRFRYILVDEFQDTNMTQYHLVRLLSKTHNNVCVVGDDDQSIYRWRGANLENILNFEKDFPGAATVKLEENYRSTQNILQAAGAVVRENVNRKEKTLWTRNAAGERVTYYRAEDEDDEALSVCEKILKLNREEGYSLNEMAVLYRTNAQSRALEDQLRKLVIPYQVVGGLRFYERKEIKDVLAFMRVVLNPADSVSLQRIINVPPRGIGKTSLEKVMAYCDENKIPLMDGLRQVEEKTLTSPAAARKIIQFLDMVGHLDRAYRQSSPLDFLREIFERTGYAEMLEKDKTRENRGRLDNLKELYSALEKHLEKDGAGSLKDFLDAATLVSDADNVDDSRGILPLMTLHSCKGLEFQVAFIVGMENGLLPHASSMNDNEEYEEERRLCYVGFTRAKKKLILTNARRRRIYGNAFCYPPSDFLLSIPSELIEKEESAAIQRGFSAPPYSADDRSPPPGYCESFGKYSVGTKVLHPTFGSGVVVNKEGNDDDLIVIVFFKSAGKKKLAINHANLIVL